jgi:hypothetical protein
MAVADNERRGLGAMRAYLDLLQIQMASVG